MSSRMLPFAPDFKRASSHLACAFELYRFLRGCFSSHFSEIDFQFAAFLVSQYVKYNRRPRSQGTVLSGRQTEVT